MFFECRLIRTIYPTKLLGSSLNKPDDTWLNRIDIRGNEIQIQGESSTAEMLISLVDSSPLFQNPQFRSPVTQVPRSERERFHLSAELEVDKVQ